MPLDDAPRTDSPGDPPGRRTRTTPAIVATVLAALVVAGLVVAVVASRRQPADQAPGTPEATVQAYFRALTDGTPDAMRATFTDELAARCTTMGGLQYRPEVSRVALAGTEISGDRATVRVSITERFEGNILGNDESTFDESVSLTRSGDAWRISTAPWPYLCEGKFGP